MLHYFVKTYSMVGFQFDGGSNFSITVFNPYAMEINYPPYRLECADMTPITIAFKLSDNEIDKLNGIFVYNAYNTCLGDYDLLIVKEHLKRNTYYKVLDNDACSELGLDESITFIKIGFKCLMFKIRLKWCNGMLLFDNGWHTFVKAINIRKGDVLVFQSTSHCHKYEISLFEKKIVSKYCRIEGTGHPHIVKKWFKILNETTIFTGEMEIPRKFVDNYGWTVGEHVKLVVSDVGEHSVKFWKERNVLYGLSELLEIYSLPKSCVLVFTYMEFSTFYVEMFDRNGRNNLDVGIYPESDPLGSTDLRSQGMQGENMVNEQSNENEFTVIIKKISYRS
ncbi:hypothetical protein POM88_007992 [Heracleum sosnowskyi]|uniref:TF-B3 domain-containing protein n=1 Tax=Heracleum sosnowskyi TaxID=360622 RepID=A0AAD8J771_9APIA|nr:hypothetical protein POM88_007992 [Heracleum sosnowskyi]